MRHGPEPRMDNREDQIWDWVSNTGEGIFDFSFGDIPPDCLQFIYSQLERFNIPYTNELAPALVAAGSAAFYWCDYVEPYTLFYGVSDIDITSDWAKSTFEIHDPYVPANARRMGDGIQEADPERLETFLYKPNQAEQVFEHCMARPGLDSLPFSIGEGIGNLLWGEYNGEEVWDGLNAEEERELRRLCTYHDSERALDVVSETRMKAYCQLAAWAAFLWLAGPLGRRFRGEHNVIMEACLEYGECILADGVVVVPQHYVRIERPPKSCHICGLDAWCVELTQDGKTTRHICERCHSADMPNWGFANCGTRYCKYASCPYNPFHHHGQSGVYEAAKHHGMLNSMAKQGFSGTIMGQDTAQKLLQNS